jgi:hypothetical protein
MGTLYLEPRDFDGKVCNDHFRIANERDFVSAAEGRA